MGARSDQITVAEAGRRGGLITLQRHGKEHLKSIGLKGSKSQHDKYPLENFQTWGRLGGRPRKKTLAEMMEEEPHLRKEADGGRPEAPPPSIKLSELKGT